MLEQGLFITLEGVDGAGKSSHLGFIENYLKEHFDKEIIFTREPGGTKLSEQLRALLLNEEMSIETEVLLMFAARQENLKQIILPALKENKIVLSDRFTDSTLAYQGGGRGFDLNKIAQITQWVHADLTPHLTILFDVPIDVAKKRLNVSRLPDRFEQQGDHFFNSVREKYLSIAEKNSDRFIIIDSSSTFETVQSTLKSSLNNFFNISQN